jgi:hypothetical protein
MRRLRTRYHSIILEQIRLRLVSGTCGLVSASTLPATPGLLEPKRFGILRIVHYVRVSNRDR